VNKDDLERFAASVGTSTPVSRWCRGFCPATEHVNIGRTLGAVGVVQHLLHILKSDVVAFVATAPPKVSAAAAPAHTHSERQDH
jgi:hypothetical protein